MDFKELDRLFATRIGLGSHVLELAPGTGINLVGLQKQATGFASYLGIDISEAMLKRARRKAGNDPRVRLRLGDATDLSSLDARFDFIVCTWLLSHLDFPAEAVRGAVAKLAPGGTAVFVFFAAPSDALLRALGRAFVGSYKGQYVDPASISTIPNLERMTRYASGFATLALFHAA